MLECLVLEALESKYNVNILADKNDKDKSYLYVTTDINGLPHRALVIEEEGFESSSTPRYYKVIASSGLFQRYIEDTIRAMEDKYINEEY